MSSPAPAGRGQATPGHIKVWFRFVPREGRLPYDTEGLWATPVNADTARIDNVPFLAVGVAQGDIVRFTTDTDGLNWATQRVECSGSNTVRILPIAGGPLGPSATAVHELLAPFGIGGEAYSPELPLVAIDVPADADLRQIKALLVRGQNEGWWAFETSCVGEAWNNA